MKPFESIHGQADAVTILERSIAKDRLASAYLFHGPSGVGKERTALALAAACVAGDDAHVRERVLSLVHPDVRVFRPRAEGNRNIQIELVRSEILPFTQFAPFESNAAFLIFPEADVSFPENHPEAANALLKSIEEPKPSVHFILLAERPNRLLRTIRSRCQPLRFAALGPAELDLVLASEGIPSEARPVAIALASGRADRALALARAESTSALFERGLAMHRLTRGVNPGSFVREAERLAKLEDADLALELEAFALVERDLFVLALAGRQGRPVFAHEAATLASEPPMRPEALAARESLIRRSLDSLESNANTQTVLDALFFSLARFV